MVKDPLIIPQHSLLHLSLYVAQSVGHYYKLSCYRQVSVCPLDKSNCPCTAILVIIRMPVIYSLLLDDE